MKRSIEEALWRYVGIRARSEQEIRTYLQKKARYYELSGEKIDQLIERFRELEIINDIQFAQSVAHSVVSSKAKGQQWLKAKLHAAGVDKDIITTTIQSLDPEDVSLAMERRLTKYERKLSDLPPREWLAKAYNVLFAAGFSSSEIRKFLDERDKNR